MFLLSALAAVLAETSLVARQRGALHELGRRVGIGGKPGPDEAPKVSRVNDLLIRFAVENFETTDLYHWSSIDDFRLKRLLQAWYEDETTRVVKVFWKDVPALKYYADMASIRMITQVRQEDALGVSIGAPRSTARTRVLDAVLEAALFRTGAPVSQWINVQVVTHAIPVRDWVLAEGIDASRYDWPGLVAGASAWHARLAGAVGFRSPVPDALVLARDRDGWTPQRLTEKTDLAHEGTSMGHCVGGPDRGGGRRDGESHYWQEVRDDKTVIVSLRDPDKVPWATVEMAPSSAGIVTGVIDQVQGPQDGPLTDEATSRLLRFFHALGADRFLWGVHRLGLPLVLSGDWEEWPDREVFDRLAGARYDGSPDHTWHLLSSLQGLLDAPTSITQVRPNQNEIAWLRAQHPNLTLRGFMGSPTLPVWVGIATDGGGVSLHWFTWCPNTAPSARPFGLESGPVRLASSFVDAARQFVGRTSVPDPAEVAVDSSLLLPVSSRYSVGRPLSAPYRLALGPVAAARARRKEQAS